MASQNEGHRGRLKERFLKEGLVNFPPHNVLELLLFYAVPRRDTNQLAHQLLEKFGSLSGVLDASVEDLQRVEGLGPHGATLLKLCGALVPLYLEDSNAVGNVLDTTDKIVAYLIPKFLGRSSEAVYILCLDSKKKLLSGGFLSEGGIDSVAISSRAIAERALAVRATGVILAHNHPGGFALPSLDDIRSSQMLYRALQPLAIRLTDHFIIAGNDAVSLAESGVFSQL